MSLGDAQENRLILQLVQHHETYRDSVQFGETRSEEKSGTAIGESAAKRCIGLSACGVFVLHNTTSPGILRSSKGKIFRIIHAYFANLYTFFALLLTYIFSFCSSYHVYAAYIQCISKGFLSSRL